jgi:hypothetical protein
MERGAVVNSRDIWNSTALHEASGCGYLNVVEQFTNLGVDKLP